MEHGGHEAHDLELLEEGHLTLIGVADERGEEQPAARSRVELLVEVRAVASSRRPGFAKTRLAANLHEAGIEYLHLRALGTPADGRAAARAGRHAEMQAIYRVQLATDAADQVRRWGRMTDSTDPTASTWRFINMFSSSEPQKPHPSHCLRGSRSSAHATPRPRRFGTSSS